MIPIYRVPPSGLERNKKSPKNLYSPLNAESSCIRLGINLSFILSRICQDKIWNCFSVLFYVLVTLCDKNLNFDLYGIDNGKYLHSNFSKKCLVVCRFRKLNWLNITSFWLLGRRKQAPGRYGMFLISSHAKRYHTKNHLLWTTIMFISMIG